MSTIDEFLTQWHITTNVTCNISLISKTFIEIIPFIALFLLSGFKTPEILRQKLQSARDQNDKQNLEKILNECIAAGMPELENDIELARNDLNYIGYDVRG